MFINAIECLEWDSQFFGYSVAKIVLDAQGYYLIEDLFKQIVTKKIRLTYLFVPISQTKLNNLISDKGSILVDQKTVFSKKTEKHIKIF
jgi:hypothetical protein